MGMLYFHIGVQYMISTVFVGSYKEHHVIGTIEMEKIKALGRQHD